MTLKEKAMRMRNAINDIELALNAEGMDALVAWPDLWKGDARPDLALSLRVNISAGTAYQLAAAYRELNTIINSDEFSPQHFQR